MLRMTREARRRAPRLEALEDRRLLAVSLAFDYSLDSSGFFTPARRTLLESTLTAITSRLGDTLAAVPTSTYSLATASGNRSVTTSVPADVIKVYAYGDALTGSIAQGGGYFSTGPGGGMRGQAPNDYAPDITYLKFDNDDTSWFFGPTTAGLTATQVDFVTVARHEFLHAMGFLSSQPGYARYVQGSNFVGPNAMAAFGGSPVPITGSHVAQSVPSLMNPVTMAGERTDVGPLEWGFLRDFGWTVTTAPTGFYREVDLFTGGQGDGTATVQVDPSRGVYLMALDVLAGDTVRLTTSDVGNPQPGVDTFLKIFSENGTEVLRNNDTAAGGKEDLTYTFAVGGRYWVGASTAGQQGYSFATPSTAFAPAVPFRLRAVLTGRAADEPHDIAAATQPVAFGDGTFATQTTLDSDQPDVYRIAALAGSTYVVTTSLPAAGGLAGSSLAAIYDAAGRRVAAMAGAGPYGSLTWVAPSTGVYYVRIARAAGPASVPLDEPAGTGFNVTDPSGEFSAQGSRPGGNDYALTITQTTPLPPASVDPLFADFGAFGLWRWTEAGGWGQINPSDPEDFVVAADGSLFVDYGSFGLWRWTASAGLQSLGPANPSAMTPASDGSLFVDFGSFGLWRWTAAAGFQAINTSDPEGFAAGPDGSLYVDYGSFGVWRWTASAGLQLINGSDPQGLAAGPAGILYIDFGQFGLWLWNESSGLHQMNAADPQGLAAGPGGTLYIDFGPNGLWLWSGGAFNQINPADPQAIAVASDGWLYIDFGAFGVWRWASVGGIQQINTADPQRLGVRPSFGRA